MGFKLRNWGAGAGEFLSGAFIFLFSIESLLTRWVGGGGRGVWGEGSPLVGLLTPFPYFNGKQICESLKKFWFAHAYGVYFKDLL